MMLATAFDASESLDLGSTIATTETIKLEWFLPEDELDQESFDVPFQFENNPLTATARTTLNAAALITGAVGNNTNLSATSSLHNNIVATTSIKDDFPWLEGYILDVPSIGNSISSINSLNDDAVAKLFGSVAMLPGSRLGSASAQLSQGSFASSLPLTPPQSPPLADNNHTLSQMAPYANIDGGGFVLGQVATSLATAHMDFAAMEICEDMDVMVTTAFGAPTLSSLSPDVEVVADISPMNSIEIQGPPISPLSPQRSVTQSPTSSICDDSNDPTYVPDMTICTLVSSPSINGCGINTIAKNVPRKRGRKPDKATAYLSKTERKRLQNKKAATRYREKLRTKANLEDEEEEELREQNVELQTQVDKLESEIQFTKNLFREMLRKRGIQI